MQRKKWLGSILTFLLAAGLSACNFPMGGASQDAPKSESVEESDVIGGSEKLENSGESNVTEDIVTDEFSIHFLYFNNAISGDCTLIKVGDIEVLIDAGSTRGSTRTIIPYIQKYCTDGILEYVIATHAHEDHIAGFVGENGEDGVFSAFECKTIIDFAGKNTASQVSSDYIKLRDKEVSLGATHYTALECCNEENGAARSYSLGDGIAMNILYHEYYEKASKENNYSVCMLFTEGDNHYLFTGDLEKEGEKSLVKNNDLPKCALYKGGHHGSDTSSSLDLLEVIQPDVVCVCSCCGDKHGFVKQGFIDNVAKYTDRVYITTVREDGVAKPLNGNIIVTVEAGKLVVNCTNNNILFKDCDWFKENRITPPEWE